MNLNLGINPPQSKEAESLYKLAYQCAHYQATTSCSNCHACPCNVEQYGYDPNQARLIRARAHLDYAETVTNRQAIQKAEKKASHLFTLSIILLLLFLFVGMTFVAHAEPNFGPASRPKTIEEAIVWVQANVRDVNKDKKLDCIDYAVIFYEIWPDSQLIRCWNDDETFNHLLNKVGDRYVEPRISNGDPAWLWPMYWAHAYKLDETHVWSVYATRKRW
jgi:hypothetical protein